MVRRKPAVASNSRSVKIFSVSGYSGACLCAYRVTPVLQDLYFEKGWLLPALFMGVILISTGIGYRKGSLGGVCSTAFIVFGNTGSGAFLRRVNLGGGRSFGNCIPQFWRHFAAIHGRNICPHMRGSKILQNALS